MGDDRAQQRRRAARLVAGLVVILTMSACASTPYGQDKVTVCHKDKKTLVLPSSAVDAHLGHGDTLGPCY